MVKIDIRVIYGDTDQMGVVYYANYLRYFEAGRNEFLRAKGARYRDVEAEHRIRLPVVEAQVNYRQPAHYDDLLTVETALSRISRASVRFQYRVVRGASLLATGHTVHACVDMEGRVQRLPGAIVEHLRAGAGEEAGPTGSGPGSDPET
jgi:acyl-CoA thioester hydrolase